MKLGKCFFFTIQCALYTFFVISMIAGVNYAIDASSIIKPNYTQMAKLALAGNIVEVPKNYNERAYQVSIIEEMDEIPNTVVIGSSRGMFLGIDTTGIEDIYNNCVSGASIEDDYALLGLYFQKFEKLPSHIILEVSPWIFYEYNPEARWKEYRVYSSAAEDFYYLVNGRNLSNKFTNENPYTSVPYFQYNIEQLVQNGPEILKGKNKAKISTNEKYTADYPDGTIRYYIKQEQENPKRLEVVQSTVGPCTYQNVNMTSEISKVKRESFESLVDYMQKEGCEVEIYLQPFSVTQCKYSFDEKENECFAIVEDYLKLYSETKRIPLRGSYDARKLGLTDNRFIDNMHLDRKGTSLIWD